MHTEQRRDRAVHRALPSPGAYCSQAWFVMVFSFMYTDRRLGRWLPAHVPGTQWRRQTVRW